MIQAGELSWKCLPVSELSSSTLQVLESLVNDAFHFRVRLFPQDRLAPGSLLQEYGSTRAIYAQAEEEVVGCVYVQQKEKGMWANLLAVAPRFKVADWAICSCNMLNNMRRQKAYSKSDSMS